MNESSPRALHPIVRFRYAILMAFAAVVLWLVPGATQVRNDDDVLAFLPPESPDVVAFHEVSAAFGMLEVGLVGLAGESGEDLLRPVAVERIRSLGRRVGELPGVRLVLTFADLPHPEVVDDGVVVSALVPEGLEDSEKIRARVLASTDAVGNLIASSGEAAAMLVFLEPKSKAGADGFAARVGVLNDVRRTVEEGWDGELHFAGAPFVEMEASVSSRKDIETLSPIVIGVLVVVSAFFLRSLTAAVINLLVTGLGVAIVMGAHGRFDEPLTIVSSSIPVMMIALGGAFGMHMLAGYQRRSGDPKMRASEAVRELWLPVTLSGTTTSVAFFALLVMPQVPMQRFGVAAGVGVLVLFLLALLVIPAMLACLPKTAIPTRPEMGIPMPPIPPAWTLAVLAVVGIGAATTLKADPDTAANFAEDSAPRQADAFFQEHFGGSTYLQIAVTGDLREKEVLRSIRDLTGDIAGVEGVVDVRSVMQPVEVLNAALGGRRGVPETSPRAGRVLTYLIGHPAMAQLMTEDVDGALIHVKLAPMDGEAQVELARTVQAMTASYGELRSITREMTPALIERRRADVGKRLTALLGRPMEMAVTAKKDDASASPALLAEVTKLRDEALDPEAGAVAVAVPDAERVSLKPEELLSLRGAELETLMTARLPTVAAGDPEGIKFAAEHLGAWIDEAMKSQGSRAYCGPLKLSPEECDRAAPVLSELDDESWAVPRAQAGEGDLPLEFEARVTGQPLIGAAFASSVTTSLWKSTLVSIVALALVLALSKTIFALLPALWTLTFVGGALALLGYPISVGTSMISCIALGAGVDFAIHLGLRARAVGGAEPGRDAVRDLGGVVLVSSIQLALAFCVLRASTMPPLQQFGIGLGLGLVGAALGALWFTPWLLRRREASGSK
ncbi:MAG: efflux RND transporter permease subunit [Nannocystaceae bacterium]